MRGTGTDMDLDNVLGQAAAATAEFARQTPQQRYAQLVEIANRLDAAADELVPVAMEETHLPEPRLRGELARTTMQLRLFAEQAQTGEFLDVRIDDPDPDFGSGPRPNLRRMRIPIGVVLNFAASNFPFAFSVAGGDTASALAAGCPVVVKAHEGTRNSVSSPGDSSPQHSTMPEPRPEPSTSSRAVTPASTRSATNASTRQPSPDRCAEDCSWPASRPTDRDPSRSTENWEASTRCSSARPQSTSVDRRSPRASWTPSPSAAASSAPSRASCSCPPATAWTTSSPSGSAENAPAHYLPTPSPPASPTGSRRSATRSADGCSSNRQRSMLPSAALLSIDYPTFVEHADNVLTEAFGPFSIIVEYTDVKQLTDAASRLHGSLTITLHAEEADADTLDDLLRLAETRTGRILLNEWPTGVSVTPAQHHGGPFPSTTSPLHTAVGTAAVERFLRPVAFQNYFDSCFPNTAGRQPLEHSPKTVAGRTIAGLGAGLKR